MLVTVLQKMKFMNKKENIRVIISGGGTGGHIFPAISIANALQEEDSSIEILFVGANNRMEMERVPAAGYNIKGLPIVGFQRKITFKSITFFFKLFRSLFKASRIIKEFKPDVAVGVGGYASGALLYMAAIKGIPSLIQEQNSYPGMTNKLLKNKAKKICVAYPNMERFFPKEKIILTGNPVRSDILSIADKKKEGLEHFDFEINKKTIVVLGGSLGARTLNRSLIKDLDKLIKSDVQVLWQTGKFYINEVEEVLKTVDAPNIKAVAFISRMDLAYAAADVIISRAGAGTISELCLVGKACILVPSPNVTEDHQTMNALQLSNNNAAILIKDVEAGEKLVNEALNLISDKEASKKLSDNIYKMRLPDSAKLIADEVLQLIKTK